jgi:hypothetical protein
VSPVIDTPAGSIPLAIMSRLTAVSFQFKQDRRSLCLRLDLRQNGHPEECQAPFAESKPGRIGIVAATYDLCRL